MFYNYIATMQTDELRLQHLNTHKQSLIDLSVILYALRNEMVENKEKKIETKHLKCVDNLAFYTDLMISQIFYIPLGTSLTSQSSYPSISSQELIFQGLIKKGNQDK